MEVLVFEVEVLVEKVELVFEVEVEFEVELEELRLDNAKLSALLNTYPSDEVKFNAAELG